MQGLRIVRVSSERIQPREAPGGQVIVAGAEVLEAGELVELLAGVEEGG